MMKKFIIPQLEISEFSMEKVVMASGVSNWLPVLEDEKTKVRVDFEQLMTI